MHPTRTMTLVHFRYHGSRKAERPTIRPEIAEKHRQLRQNKTLLTDARTQTKDEKNAITRNTTRENRGYSGLYTTRNNGNTEIFRAITIVDSTTIYCFP